MVANGRHERLTALEDGMFLAQIVTGWSDELPLFLLLAGCRGEVQTLGLASEFL